MGVRDHGVRQQFVEGLERMGWIIEETGFILDMTCKPRIVEWFGRAVALLSRCWCSAYDGGSVYVADRPCWPARYGRTVMLCAKGFARSFRF